MSRPLVAEIVGPAGAGKSTLARAIEGRCAGARADLGVWGLPKRLLLAGAVASLPRLVGPCRVGRIASLEEAELVVRLEALTRRVAREPSRRDGPLLLDEGPVFALAKLLTTGGAGGGCETRARELVGRYAGMLDAVIWLDAPDAVLARRIRERDKPHRVKAQTDGEIAAFLALYRESYERVLAEMCARRDLKLIRVSTDAERPEGVAGRVPSMIEEARTSRDAFEQAKGARGAGWLKSNVGATR